LSSSPAPGLIAIAGPPGSGTTTAASGVANALGLELVLGGRVFRAMAVERGMSLSEFGVYAAAQPAVDEELDRRLADRARLGGVVVESRLSGWILLNEGLDGLRVCLQCDERVRAERVAARENVPIEQAHADNAEREKVEHDRYLALYDIEIADLSIYDLIVDTGALGVEETTERIAAAALARFPRLRG
jgi:cytidylate kinase